MEYSKYQINVIKGVANRSGNMAVNAVAGSGKTFTICEAAQDISSVYSVLLSAFGKDIERELHKRNLPRHCTIKTYNAFGWGICRKANDAPIHLNEHKTVDTLKYKVLGISDSDEQLFNKWNGSIKRLVSLGKSNLYTPESFNERFDEIIDHYGLECPSEDAAYRTALVDTYQHCFEDKFVYDFNDQIFIPVMRNYNIPVYDYVFIDEYQDTSLMEAELMLRASRGGIACAVGDPDQTIYGFKGATPGAFQAFIQNMRAKEYPLSICYRCSVSVINEAQKIVPRIEAAPGAKKGSVDRVKPEFYQRNVRPGDFVICRTTEPLVSKCLAFLEDRVPAQVMGREIGDSVEYLITSIDPGLNMGIDTFLKTLAERNARKIEVLERARRYKQAEGLQDRHDTVIALSAGCVRSGEIVQRLKHVFADKGVTSVKLMTGHKSKGLQAPRVWLLRPDLIPHYYSLGTPWMLEEESRLKYVIVTRAQESFFYVDEEFAGRNKY